MPKTGITRKNRDAICSKIDWEGGFEYFITGSDFAEIKDKRFHEFRESFVKAYKELEDYIEYSAYQNTPVFR